MGYDLSLAPMLVTGASGYLGRNILNLLKQQGIPAIGTARSEKGMITCDLNDADETRRLLAATKAKTVIHCAAHVPKNIEGYGDERACASSLRMVSNILLASPARVVFTSSMTVYGANSPLPVEEKDVSTNLAGYALAKRLAELALLEAQSVAVAIVRLPGLFGPPRKSGLLYNAACAFARREKPQVTPNPPVWAAMHVEDAAQACVKTALSDFRRSLIMNVGYPEIMSIPRAISMLANVFGQTSRRCTAAPDFMMDLGVMQRELGLSSHSLEERLQQLAGWARLEVDASGGNKN